MNFFHTILQKLGFEKPAAAPAPAAPTAAPAPVAATVKPVPAAPAAVVAAAVAAAAVPAPAAPAPAKPAPVASTPAVVYSSMPNIPPSSTPAVAKPVAIAVVDVISKLDGLAKSRPELDWKVSIVDMLKLLDMDSSFEARKALAEELECPADQMNDSARMNVWLHKTVLQKIAENGGNIPASLLD